MSGRFSTKRKNVDRRAKYYLAAVAGVLGLLVTFMAPHHGGPFSAQWLSAVRTALPEQWRSKPVTLPHNSYTDGTLDGIRIHVPSRYQFFPIAFAGVDPWKPSHTDDAMRQRGLIHSFSLRLHFPDYSLGDSESATLPSSPWLPDPDQSWANIHVEGRPTAGDPTNPDWLNEYLTKKKEFAEGWSGTHGHWKYDKVSDAYGLNREVLDGPDHNEIDSRNQTLYYDGSTPTMLLSCEDGAVGKGGAFNCTEDFLMPDTFWFVSVTFGERHAQAWSDIKEQTIRAIKSLLVTH